MSGTVGVAPGTTTVRLPDGRVVALTDWIDDKLYGTIQLRDGQQQAVNAYSTGLSQVIPGGTRSATEADTNVPRNGDSGLPQAWEFLNYGWGIKFPRVTRPTAPSTTIDSLLTFSNPITLETFFEIDRKLFFHFKYNRKDYTEGVCQDYPQGHGIWLQGNTATNTNVAQNGVISPRDRVALVIPVDLCENLSFAGIFAPMVSLVISQPASDQGQGGANLTFVDLKLYMYGLMKRPVV